METAITNGIKISIEAMYMASHSIPFDNKFLFKYNVTIENYGKEPVQLRSRYWKISDSLLNIRKVSGDGVIGEQPIIESGKKHEYSSWCPLRTPIGKMEGHYVMRILNKDEFFNAEIPSFDLIADYIHN